MPDRGPPFARQAGVCLHVTSLPGPFGIGEIGAHARHFVDALRDMRIGVWQFLPIGPTAYADSPYQPLSTFAGNELLIDIAELLDLGLLADEEVGSLRALPTDTVNYGALIPHKNRVLALAAGRFSDRADDATKQAYQSFVDEHDAEWLHDYALFRLLKTQHHERPWPEWEAKFQHRDPTALADLTLAAAAQIDVIKILQFIFDQQWRRLKQYANAQGVSLFGDMPIYIALDSADAWSNRDLLQVDRDGKPDYVAGVPPDYFSEDGQLWGNPLYAWEAHSATDYRWWTDRVRAATSRMDMIRIDHFRGFESYWSVAADAQTARHGTWEAGPCDAIFDALRRSLGDLPVIAENLGVITAEVEALRDRQGMPGMRVLQFDVCNPEFQLTDIAANTVCYTGTHDNDTTVGWFYGGDDDIRSGEEVTATQQAVLRVTRGTPATLHIDLIHAALSTASFLAIAPMQDFLGLGSDARMNTPGTSSNNWRWRMCSEQITTELQQLVATMVGSAGRAPIS